MKSPLRILYLEDDPRDAELVQETLASVGFTCDVTRVETEADFVASLEEGGFDLILAEDTLPTFDGLSALKIAQRDWPHLPLIFVSGALGEEVAIQALQIGATDHVSKTRLSRIAPSVQRALREAEQQIGLSRAEEALRRSEAHLAEARERELFARQRATELAKANEEIRGCLDALGQSFTGISMQLGVAEEQLAAKQGDPLGQVQRANEIAKFGLAQARRSILSLHSSAIEESGLATRLQRLVETSNVAGLLRCDFRSDRIPEEGLPSGMQHELLRFAQEAIGNAVHLAKPTVVSVTLRWEPPNLILQVTDNGSGISRARLEKSEGFGLRNMRARASQIDGKLDIHTAADHGTSIVLTVPIST